MLDQEEINSLQARFEECREIEEVKSRECRKIEEDKHSMMKNYLGPSLEYQNLKKVYEQKSRDYDAEVESRWVWQDKADVERGQNMLIRQSIECNPFVLVLVDGDGYIFREELLKAGRKGGARAAEHLHESIKSYIHTLQENAGQWAVMVRVYVNSIGLAEALIRSKCIKAQAEFSAFGSGFTQRRPLFGFVDVGGGKERADHKIRETFRLFVDNHHCRHIIFAGCHDNGYVPSLDPYNKEFSHITLLEAAQPAAEFRALSFPIMTSPSVFRSDPLQKEYRPQSPAVAIGQPGNRPTANGNASQLQVNVPSDAGVRNHSEARVILLNGQGERIDSQLPQYPNQASIWLKKREEQVKLCYGYYLTGRCTVSSCQYNHDLLAQDQVLVLRHRFRKQVCSEGAKCRSFDCYYGHQCPYAICYKPQKCQFGPLHKMDMVKAQDIFETLS